MITSFNSFLTYQSEKEANIIVQLINANIVLAIDNDFTTIANGFNFEIATIKQSTLNIKNMKAVGEKIIEAECLSISFLFAKN